MTENTPGIAPNHSKIALVNRANKGIGGEAAHQLAATKGVMVWPGARDEQRGRSAEAGLRAGGADVRFVRLDVTDPDTIEAVVKQLRAQRGRLDILG